MGSTGSQAGGHVQVQGLLCKSCGLCAEYCPQELMKPATEVPPDQQPAATMNPAGHVLYVIHDPQGRCNGCGICAGICPEGAIVVYRRKKAAASPGKSSPVPPEGKKSEEDAHG